MVYLSRNAVRVSISTVLFSLVTACGGGAGDDIGTTSGESAAEAVEPFVGVWNLPDDWNGVPNDEAYLLVKSPDDDGVAEATIYDFDDAIAGAENNCFNIDGAPGTLSQSLTDELFLDVSAYPSAVVALTLSGDLEISVYSESAGTGVPPDRVLIATRLNITENEITLCS